MHSNNPNSKALNSIILLVSRGIGLAILPMINPKWSLITYPIPEGPGLLLEDPSKFNFNHPCLGGVQIASFLDLGFCPKEEGILIPANFSLYFHPKKRKFKTNLLRKLICSLLSQQWTFQLSLGPIQTFWIYYQRASIPFFPNVLDKERRGNFHNLAQSDFLQRKRPTLEKGNYVIRQSWYPPQFCTKSSPTFEAKEQFKRR